jgi:hypothetical protein
LNAVLELRDLNKIMPELDLTSGYLATPLTLLFTTRGITVNELIEKFAIDCAGQMVWDFPKDPEEFTFTRDELAKFAQSIVRECLDIVNRHEYSYHEADPLWETAQLIKQHFGVEQDRLNAEMAETITDLERHGLINDERTNS